MKNMDSYIQYRMFKKKKNTYILASSYFFGTGNCPCDRVGVNIHHRFWFLVPFQIRKQQLQNGGGKEKEEKNDNSIFTNISNSKPQLSQIVLGTTFATQSHTKQETIIKKGSTGTLQILMQDRPKWCVVIIARGGEKHRILLRCAEP